MKTIQLTDAQIYHLRHAIEYYKCGQDDLLEHHKETLAFNKNTIQIMWMIMDTKLITQKLNSGLQVL